MKWVLTIFWWGHHAGVAQTIPFESEELCKAAKKHFERVSEEIAGTMHISYVKIRE